MSQVVKTFKSIFSEGRKPKLSHFDKGLEFKGQLLKLFKDLAIHHFVTQNEGKANYAERCIKTLKNLIYHYLSHTQKERFIEKLPDLVSSYNQSFYSTACMAPSKVNKLNERGLFFIWFDLTAIYTREISPTEKISLSIT